MDRFKNLPREAQVTLTCLVLFVIFSFFDWQQASVFGHSYGDSLWHGFGIITALIAVAYLIWEIGRALEYKVDLGQVTPPMTSAGLSIVLLLCTVIVFFDWSDFRHWPAFVGLILSIVITVFALKRAKDEGVEMPKMPQNVTVGKSAAAGGAASTAAPAAPPPAAPPAAPAEPAAPPVDEAGGAPDSTEA
jgi:hypothetical protein